MADIRPGGLIEVHYSDTGAVASWTKITGDIHNNTDGMTPEAILNELTKGSSQSGSSFNPTIQFEDFTDFATVEGFAVGALRTKKWFAFVFDGNIIYRTTEAVHPIVLAMLLSDRRQGDSTWSLQLELHATNPFEKIASLT